MNQNNFQNEKQSDEIELFDVLNFVWKIRKFLIVAPIVAVIACLVLQFTVLTAKYSISWQATVENNSESIFSEADKLTERFQKVFARPENALKIVQLLSAEIPEFKATLENNPAIFKGYVNSLIRNSKLSSPLIKVTSSTSGQDFTVDFATNASFRSQRTMESATKIVNQIVELNNTSVLNSENFQMKELKETIRQLQADVSLSENNNEGNFFKEQSAVWQHCTRLETKLFRLAEQKGLLNSSKSMLLRASGNQGGFGQDFGFSSSENATLTSYRLLAILEDQGKFPSDETQKIRDELLDLDQRLEKIRKDKLREQSVTQNVLKGVMDNFQKSANTGASRSLMLPKLRISQIEMDASEGAAKNIDLKRQHDTSIYGIAAFVGILLGFAIGSFTVFWNVNCQRLADLVGGK